VTIELPALRLPSLSEWIDLLGGFYDSWGYPLVLIAAALENTFLLTIIVPGGTMVLLGGVYARLGVLELPFVILVGWCGTFVGASIDYALGRWGHQTRLRGLLARPAVAGPLERAGAMLGRYGMLALFGGHFVSQIRSLVAVAAGVTRLPYRRFALYEAPVALVWASAYAVGGYLLADQIPLFEDLLQRFGWVLAALTAAFFVWRVLATRRRATPRAPVPASE
jgi:membrane protein DedA with SNARE-associated domain